MAKIAPCAHCGGEGRIDSRRYFFEDGTFAKSSHTVACRSCGATGGEYWSKAAAVANWNRRA